MVLTGTFSITNWINSRPLTDRPVSVRRNVRAYPTVITAVASAENSFPGGGDSGDDDLGHPEDGRFGNNSGSASSSWRANFSSWSFPARNWPLVLRTVAFHATHITARFISQPFQPAWEKLQQRAANSPAVQSACSAFQVEDLASLHDVANALVLAECVYKVVGRPEQEAVRIMSGLKSNFPPGIVTISSVQFARSHVRHRFAISQSDDAMYVAFMGTKLPRDFIANASAWQEEVQLDADTVVKSNDAEKMTLSGSGDGSTPGVSSTSSTYQYQQQAPAAHRGFLTRARGIPIDALFAEAQKRGKRLVLCGHSLGGAVATLTAIKLLQRLPPEQHNLVSCVGFATPALGNTALATMVKERQWHDRIINYLVPEDPIPRLLSVNNNSSPDTSTSKYNNSGVDEEKRKSSNGSVGGDCSSGGVPDVVGGESSLPSQFDVVGNIAAVPGRLLSLSRRSASSSSIKQEQEPALAETTSSLAAIETTPAEEIKDGTNTTASSSSSSQSSSPQPGLRRSISQGTLKMVNIATAPLRRPNYQPIGRQLFICEEAVKTERPVGSSSISGTIPVSNNTSSTANAAVASLQRSSSGSSSGSGNSSSGVVVVAVTKPSEKPTNTPQWWSRLPFASSLVFLPTGNEGEGDDDNVDVAAATAAAGGIVPDRLPRRTLFPMHRMLTYRTRLLSICHDALSGHRWPVSLLPASSTFGASLPHVPNFPHPDDIILSELLAPGMFPLKAEASVPLMFVQRKLEGVSPQVPFVAAAREKLTWPLRILLSRPSKDITDTVKTDVVVRVEGRGLCNVTAAWVSGGQVDVNSGKSTPIEAEIISMPRAPSPLQVVSGSSSQKFSGNEKRKSSSFLLTEPVSAVASWVAMAVGWVSLLRQLQKPGQADYLLAKVKLPASTVRAAHKANSDPFSVAVGEGPRLMMHLQSDFAVHSLPLTVQVVGDDGGSGGRGGGSGKNRNKNKENKKITPNARYKDANQVLRNAKTGLPHLF